MRRKRNLDNLIANDSFENYGHLKPRRRHQVSVLFSRLDSLTHALSISSKMNVHVVEHVAEMTTFVWPERR